MGQKYELPECILHNNITPDKWITTKNQIHELLNTLKIMYQHEHKKWTSDNIKKFITQREEDLSMNQK
jgi:hypothetical protein